MYESVGYFQQGGCLYKLTSGIEWTPKALIDKTFIQYTCTSNGLDDNSMHNSFQNGNAKLKALKAEWDSVVTMHGRRNYTQAIARILSQHVTWYMYILLACNSQVSCKISRATLLTYAYKCRVSIELYCTSYVCNYFVDVHCSNLHLNCLHGKQSGKLCSVPQ